jgi:hypothetical protein
MTKEIIEQKLEYRNGSLFWKVKPNKNIAAGARAGSKRPDGYRHVRLNKKFYQEHMLIWCLLKGEWPEQLIDHENEIRDDNRIGNLRLATKSQNAINTGKWSTNTSGYKGVSFNKAAKKWVASISVNKKLIHLGTFGSAEEANMAYKEAVKLYHGEFANKRTLCA